MEEIEIRTSPNGKVYYSVNGGDERKLTKFSTEIHPLLSVVEERFPVCYARLAELYQASKNKGTMNDRTFKMLERFVRCHFGEHDLLTADIEGRKLHFEEVKCPLRGGFCPDENVICKPKSVVNLSPEEARAAKLYVDGYTCKEIAKELGKNLNTIKVQLFRIKQKLGVKDCRGIIKHLQLMNF